jgi:5-hydroxyisourate hydrolase-like protein (transthyretin family)
MINIFREETKIMAYQSKSHRKFLATSLTAAMVATAVAPTAGLAASSFPDVKEGNFYYDYVTALAEAEIIDGRPDGSFDLGGKLNRAEAAKMISKIIKLDTTDAPAASFEDVKQGVWYSEYINALYAEGLINGLSESEFGPNAELTRAQLAKMVVEAYGLELDTSVELPFTDVKEDVWYTDYIKTLYKHDLIDGKTATTFAPNEPIKRADFAKLLTEADWAVGSTLEKPAAPEVPVAVVESVEAVANADQTITVEGTATEADSVKVSFDGETWMDAELNEDGTFSYTSEELASGVYEVSVVAYSGEVASEVKTAEVAVVSAESGVAGFVTLDGTATKGVNVTVNGQSTLTNDDGYFTLEGVAPGEYTATISKTGYATQEVKVTVLDGKASAVVKDLVELVQEDIVVSTTVVEAGTGAPAVGVTGTLERWNPTTEKWVEVTDVDTSETGLFKITNESLGLDFGDKLRLQLTKDYSENLDGAYHASEVIEFSLKTDKLVNVLNGIELETVESTTVAGKVLDVEGKVVASQSVDVLDQDGKTVLANVSTNDKGVFKTNELDLPTGTYFVKVDTAGDEAIYTAPISVEEGVATSHNIQLEEGFAVAYTVAADGVGENVPAGTYKAVIKSNGAEVASVTEEIGADAGTLTFGLDRIPAGDFTVEVTGDYIQAAEFNISVKDDDLTASNRVQLAGVVTGEVTDVDGNALTNSVVSLLNADGDVVETVKSEDGSYKFASLPAGKYTVAASKAGYVTDSTDAVTVEKAKPTNTSVALEPVVTTADVAGFVRTENTLTPAAGAEVSYYAISVDDYKSGEFVTDTAVSADGSYSFENLQPGAYQVVVRDSGSHEISVSTVTVSAGDEITNENYTLVEGGDASLELSFVDVDGEELGIEDLDITSATLADEYSAVEDSSVVTALEDLSFEKLSAGTYTLNLKATDYQHFTAVVTVEKGEENELVVSLTEVAEMHEVSVRVINEDNEDVAGAQVVALDDNGKIVAELMHTGTGFYSTNVVSGNYTVAAYVDGYVVPTASFTVADKDVVVPALRLSEKYTK